MLISPISYFFCTGLQNVYPVNDETREDGLQELERINKEIETVRNEVEQEQRRLSRYQTVQADSINTMPNFSVSKSETADKHVDIGSYGLSSCTDITTTYSRARKYVVDNSKPRTDLEYDPLSNFSAGLRSYSSSGKEQKVRNGPGLKRANNTPFDDSNEDCVLIIDIPLSPDKKRARVQKPLRSVGGKSLQDNVEESKEVQTPISLLNAEVCKVTYPPASTIEGNRVYSNCGAENNQGPLNLYENKECENISVDGRVVDLTGCLEELQSESQKMTPFQAAETLLEKSASPPATTDLQDQNWNNLVGGKGRTCVSGGIASVQKMSSKMPGQMQAKAAAPESYLELAEPTSDSSQARHDSASSLANRAELSSGSTEPLFGTEDEVITICSSSDDEDELNYSEMELSDSDPMEECYRIFMEANNEDKGNDKQPEVSVSMQLTLQIQDEKTLALSKELIPFIVIFRLELWIQVTSVLTPLSQVYTSTAAVRQMYHPPAVTPVQRYRTTAPVLIPAPARKPSLNSAFSSAHSSPPVPTKRKLKQQCEATKDKVPHDIRQRYVNMFTEEFLKTTANVNEAFEKALAEEKAVYNRSVNKLKYLSVAVNALKKLKNQNENAVNSQRSKGNIPLNMKNFRENDMAFYESLKDYILTEERLVESNYPVQHPEKPGWAVLFADNKKGSADPLKRICCRCGATYSVNHMGKHIRKEECNYHYGKGVTKKVPGGVETRYSCCEGVMGAPGCQVFKLHVHDSLSLDGFVSTTPRHPSDKNCPGVYSLNCEMCYTIHGLELSRVTVVNSSLHVVYDTFVRPDNEAIDYNTRFSGITEEDVKGKCTSLTEVQETLLSFISADTILIGHGLEMDLCALKLLHGVVVDTSVVFPHRLGLPHKLTLNNLTAEYLRRIIQESVCGHDTAEDAAACMELMLWKVKEDGKLKK
uniref:Zgc:152968 n=1 Tax=Sander lucioperca TaxID=283035 RepID=A0A8C9Y0M3_SANLU